MEAARANSGLRPEWLILNVRQRFRMQPVAGEVEEAKRHPNGWVYRIKGDFLPGEAVPKEAIVGAWKVDASGKIVGEFMPNPTHVSTFEKKNE